MLASVQCDVRECIRCETLESAAVTADCVTSEVAASERLERERERERES